MGLSIVTEDEIMESLMESDRLILREWNAKTDADAAFKIYGDPEVMRWIGDGATEPDVKAVQSRLQERIKQYQKLKDGSGFWATVEKESQVPVGTMILKRLPDAQGDPTRDWEIGWHFCQDAWGKGYATEAAKAVLAHGFKVLKLPVIYAVTRPENDRSIRVAQRLGMTPIGRTNKYYGVELKRFEMRSDFY